MPRKRARAETKPEDYVPVGPDLIKLEIGPCLNKSHSGVDVPNQCWHDLSSRRQSIVDGETTVHHGLTPGYEIWGMIEANRLQMPGQQEIRDHLKPQSSANVFRNHRKYSKQPKPVDPTKDAKAASEQPSAKARRPRERAKTAPGVIGPRASGAQTNSRLRAYNRTDEEHDMDTRNEIWKTRIPKGPSDHALKTKMIATHEPAQFPAVHFRCVDPRISISTMKTGQANIAACLDRASALLAVWNHTICQFLHFDTPAHIEKMTVVNITASAGIAKAISLDWLEYTFKTHPASRGLGSFDVNFDTEKFPNLVLKLHEHRLSFNVSSRGFVNVVGVKNEVELTLVHTKFMPIIKLIANASLEPKSAEYIAKAEELKQQWRKEKEAEMTERKTATEQHNEEQQAKAEEMLGWAAEYAQRPSKRQKKTTDDGSCPMSDEPEPPESVAPAWCDAEPDSSLPDCSDSKTEIV